MDRGAGGSARRAGIAGLGVKGWDGAGPSRRGRRQGEAGARRARGAAAALSMPPPRLRRLAPHTHTLRPCCPLLAARPSLLSRPSEWGPLSSPHAAAPFPVNISEGSWF